MKRRLELEVHWGGGKVSEGLADVTHLVLLEVPGLALDLHAITERYVLKNLKTVLLEFLWIRKNRIWDWLHLRAKESYLKVSVIYC